MLLGGVKRKMKADYEVGSRPDSKANEQFNLLTDIFNNNIAGFVDRYKSYVKNQSGENSIDPESFLDTVILFTKNFLPSLKEKSPGICKSKMDYIISNPGDLTDNISSSVQISDITISVVYNTITDFFATNDNSGYSRYKTFSSQSFYHNVSYPAKNYEVEDKNGDINNSIENKPLKCRVYIYDMQGNVIRGRFKVFFAPYVTVYHDVDEANIIDYIMQKPGTKDAGEASTAAASISNNSNWAIYCKDKQSAQTYLVNEKYNYQNIVNRDESDESSFKILILYHGN